MALKINDNGIDRDMTANEQTVHLENAKIAIAEAKANAQAQTEKQAARQAVLDKLGLTADEAAALLG